MSENNKHLTLFPRAQDTGHLSELPRPLQPDKDKGCDRPTKQERKHSSPATRLPLKVHAATTSPSEDAALISSFCKKESPWNAYQVICRDDEAGAVTIAYVRHSSSEIVAIKERDAVSEKKLDSLERVQHDNVVHFLAAFQEYDHLYLVYKSV